MFGIICYPGQKVVIFFGDNIRLGFYRQELFAGLSVFSGLQSSPGRNTDFNSMGSMPRVPLKGHPLIPFACFKVFRSSSSCRKGKGKAHFLTFPGGQDSVQGDSWAPAQDVVPTLQARWPCFPKRKLELREAQGHVVRSAHMWLCQRWSNWFPTFYEVI